MADYKYECAVILNFYRSEYLMFNDDIQGTAATTLAGIYGALKVSNVPENESTSQVWSLLMYYLCQNE